MLLKNIHEGLAVPQQFCNCFTVKGDYFFYHYYVDGANDIGWGCGYRSLQTIVSWIICNELHQGLGGVPSIQCIQSKLVEIGDKHESFIGSKEWIGTYEAFLIIDTLYKISCKILHVSCGKELYKVIEILKDHFQNTGSPIMMGGDIDCGSKTILGICHKEDDWWLLVLDPHFSKMKVYNKKQLQDESCVYWKHLSTFDDSSFYNFCIPLSLNQ
ncbi:ufm1-specific protease 1 [Hydra vulgaris]|uniref:ufm1-specific protease 1 n=1 Tax=Hydra vulgaris TaxID=6087 RepID=UPI0001926E14|nr:ufm1-specific protease 1 [Hydra vulgaris]